MPGGDGSGPAGMGPMTGRAAGYCAGYGVPGYANPVPGRGFGYGGGRGFGRGMAYGFRGGRAWGAAPAAWGAAPAAGAVPYAAPYAAGPTPEQEVEMLKGQAEYLEQTLNGIRQRLDELQTEKAEE